MRYYFYIDDQNRQVGPLNFEEFKAKGFVAGTPVWYEGLADWTTAGEVDELKAWLQAGSVQNGSCPPPPYPTTSSLPVDFGVPCREMSQNGDVQSRYRTQATNRPEAEVPRTKPDTWLVGAILSTILCCLPLGIAAIILSTTGSAQWDRGEYDQAVKSFNTAKTLTIVSIVFGILCMVFYVALLIVADGF